MSAGRGMDPQQLKMLFRYWFVYRELALAWCCSKSRCQYRDCGYIIVKYCTWNVHEQAGAQRPAAAAAAAARSRGAAGAAVAHPSRAARSWSFLGRPHKNRAWLRGCRPAHPTQLAQQWADLCSLFFAPAPLFWKRSIWNRVASP